MKLLIRIRLAHKLSVVALPVQLHYMADTGTAVENQVESLLSAKWNIFFNTPQKGFFSCFKQPLIRAMEKKNPELEYHLTSQQLAD